MAEEFLPPKLRKDFKRWYEDCLSHCDDDELVRRWFEECQFSLEQLIEMWPVTFELVQDNLCVLAVLGKYAVSDHG
jgi:hypothetical protein